MWEHSPPSKNKLNNKFLYWSTSSLFYRLADKIVVVSSGVFKDVKNWTSFLEHKLIIIFNAIPPPKNTLLNQIKSNENNIIVWVGRLDETKNPGLLLEAFALIPQSLNCSLVYVGDGYLMSELVERRSILKLDHKVKFLGFHKNPYEVIVDSDLLVLSSNREGLGNVIVEAMHCGLRVVSTSCGDGIYDILLDNEYGTIVPCADKYAMAEAIINELNTKYDPKLQIKGAERFLPEIIVNLSSYI